MFNVLCSTNIDGNRKNKVWCWLADIQQQKIYKMDGINMEHSVINTFMIIKMISMHASYIEANFVIIEIRLQ